MKTNPNSTTTGTLSDPRLAPPKNTIPARELPRAAIHPGHILKVHFLNEYQLSQTAFAQLTGLPVSRINDIVKERRSITMDAAIRLGKVLGTGEQFWLNLQTNYERALAQASKGKEYARLRPLAQLQPA